MIRAPRRFFSAAYNFGSRLSGLNIFENWRWLESSGTWTHRQRAEWRLERLNRIIAFAWNEVPFYREFWGDHGATYQKLRDFSELQEYPVLTKDVFRANSDRIRPRSLSHIRHMRKATGGSTSVPVTYLLDLEQWAMMEGFHLWGWHQAGYQPGDPVGVIAGGSLVPERMTWKGRLRGMAQRRLFLYGVAMDREMAIEYHARLVRHGTRFLYGYPSVLYLFARHLHEANLQLTQLKAVFTTAEMLLPQYRRGITEWLRCPVYDNYGSNDGGIESYECECHNGFHYNDLQSVLELETGPGNPEGPLLITNLWNTSTPFIRYQNGDIISLGKSPCPCGAPFPTITSVQGRTTDILTFRHGRALSGPALTLIFGDMKIDGWQIVQTGPMAVDVRLCLKGTIPSEYSTRILRVLSAHVGDQVAVTIHRVEQLTLTKGGKLKPVICESQGG